MTSNLNQLNVAIEFFVFHIIELSGIFLFASFFVEILNFYLSPKKVQKILSSKKSGYIIASLLGSFTPFCSCSSVPLTIGLIKAKASFGAVMTFLFTSPLLNPIIIIVFISAFGLKVTLIYAIISFCVSIISGVLLQKFGFEKFIKSDIFDSQSCCTKAQIYPKPQISGSKVANFSNFTFSKEEKKESFLSLIKSKNIYKKTLSQFFKFAPYIVLGISIGAFVHGFVPQAYLIKYAGSENPFAPFISAFIGVPLYIRADAMVGLAPALLEKGVSMGSILALTIAGAGASLPEMIMLSKIFKAPIIIFFIICVFVMAISCGYLINFYFV